jgi:hypothetical protein
MTLLAAAAAALIAVTAPGGAASAQTRGESSGTPASATIQAVFTGAVPVGHERPRIVCHIGASKPNFESTSHKKIATAGAVLCSSRVAGIAFSLLLTKDLKAVAKRGFATLGSRQAHGLVSYACPTNRVHRYAGLMFGTVVFPPGYEPQKGSFAVTSLPAHLRCR